MKAIFYFLTIIVLTLTGCSPKSPKGKEYFNNGDAKLFTQDYAGAIVEYNKALEINPRYSEAYCNRGAAKFYLQDYPETIADCTKAIEFNPKNGYA